MRSCANWLQRRGLKQAPGQTLQATALVREAFLRLTSGVRHHWQDRAHFFRAAAEAMRCILIENARRKSRWKRGGRLERVEFEGLELAADTPHDSGAGAAQAEHQAQPDPGSSEREFAQIRWWKASNGGRSQSLLTSAATN